MRIKGEIMRIGSVRKTAFFYALCIVAASLFAQTGMIAGAETENNQGRECPVDKESLKAKTADVFTSGMVLQRDILLPVWGQAPDGTAVSVLLGTNRADTVAAQEQWSILLPPMSANSIPQTLTVIYNDAVTNTFTNVLIGDVWIVSGQSNP
jgi:hypothetical protein